MGDALEAASLAQRRYSNVAIAFHWIIATLIVANLLIGFFHEGFEKPVAARLMFFHIAIGITVLALSVLRLVWRLSHRPPPFDEAMRRWEVILARTVHWSFYALMVVLPLSGWLLASTGGRPFTYLGLFPIGPLPVSTSHDSHEFWEGAHELVAKLMLGLLLLHVAGALKHHLEGHRQIIRRIVPFRGAA